VTWKHLILLSMSICVYGYPEPTPLVRLEIGREDVRAQLHVALSELYPGGSKG
jgi:hypothetical protein